MEAAPSVREPKHEASPSSRRPSRYRVKLRGVVGGRGVVVSVYLVVADSPQEAYFTALRFEPTATRRFMLLDECDFVERVASAQTGMESILARFSVPPPPSC